MLTRNPTKTPHPDNNKDLVQFSRSVVSDSLRPHEPQHARPPCPSRTPGIHPNPHPSSRWCHTTISSSVVPFSSCPQSFPAPGSFPWVSSSHIRWPKYRSFSFNISPSSEHQDWSLGWTGWISLQSKGLSRVFSNTTVQKHQFFGTQLSSQSNSHIHTWPLGKTTALTRWTFVGKVMSLLLNMLSRLVITFLPRSKRLLISWLQSPCAVILEPKKIKSDIYLPMKWWDQIPWSSFSEWKWIFIFTLPFHFHQEAF